MKKISLLTTILVSFVMVAFLVLSISIKSNNSSRFSDDGFVISSNLDESSVNRFSSDTTYNMLNNNAVSFKTTDGVKAVVNNNSFIHYADGSISAMKDGVMLELTPEITSGLSSAYFVPAKTTLLKNGNSYTVEGMTSVSLENLIYKLNHNKYLVCSSNMELNLPNNNLIKIKDFLEITYVDNGIVLLSDGDNTWTSVSLDSSLTLENGLNINFMTREIKYDKEVVLQLNRLLVNEDDSVEVLPFQDGSFTIPKISIEGINGKKGEDGKDGEDGIDGARGASGSGGANGTDGEDGEQFSDALELPVFRLNQFEVTNDSVSFEISLPEFTTLLTSPDGISANAKVRVYDHETNKLVVEDDWDLTNVYNTTDNFERVLSPNKTYRLVLNSEYFINNQKLTRDFITKVFHTTNSDLDFDVSYTKEQEINIDVTKPLGVSVPNASLYIFKSASEANQYIYDINNTSTSSIPTFSKQIIFGDSQTKTNVTFSKTSVSDLLTPDTEYAFVIGEDNKMLNKIVTAKTLKRKPTMVGASLGAVPPKPVVIENMKIYGFDLVVPEFEDLDNSLVTMNWKIYHKDSSAGQDVLVKTITLPFDQSSPTKLFIDDEVIKKGEQYKASLELVYNDNSKDVTINVGESKIFRMDNKKLPIVRFVQNEQTPDKYSSEGVLYIEDEANIIDEVQGFDIIIKSLDDYFYSYHTTATGQVNSTFSINNPFTSGLKADTQYVLDVYAHTENNSGSSSSPSYIGSCSVNTKKYEVIQADLSLTSTTNTNMLASAKFSTSTFKPETLPQYEAIMNYHMYMMKIALSIYEPGNVSFDKQYTREIYYNANDKKWYLDNLYSNELTKVNNDYVIDIGHGGFFDVDENTLKGKKVYLEILDDVAYDHTYKDTGWSGETTSDRTVYKLNELPEFVADKKGKNVDKNPYKNYQNTIGVNYTAVEIILGLRLPELFIDSPALQVDPILNINANDFGLDIKNTLADDAVIGFYVRDSIHDPHHVFTSKSYYMFETKDFNDFRIEEGAFGFTNDVNQTKIAADQEFNLATDSFTKTKNYVGYDPITTGLAFSNDPEAVKKTHIAGIKSVATITVNNNPSSNIRSGVVFLLEPGDNTVYQKTVNGSTYNMIKTSQTRGYSYTFAFTAEVNTDKFNPQPLSTYPYNHTSYDGYRSMQRSNPVFAARQEPIIHLMPYEVSSDKEKLFAKYYIYDKDGAVSLSLNNNKETPILSRDGVFENKKTYKQQEFNNIDSSINDTNISKNSLKVTNEHHSQAVLNYSDLFIPLSKKNNLYIETYNFDPLIYSYDNQPDFGKKFGTEEKLIVEGIVGKVEKDIFKYQFDSVENVTKLKVDGVTSKFESDKLITTIPLTKDEYNRKIALVEIVLKNTSNGESYSYFEPLNQKGDGVAGDYTYDKTTSTLTITSLASKFTKFSENDKLKVTVRVYFHTDLIGYSYLAGSTADKSTVLGKAFGITKNGLDGTVANYLAPVNSNTKIMISKNNSIEFAGSKSFFESFDDNQVTLNNLFKLAVKENGQAVKIKNQVNERDYDINFNYMPGQELFMPEKLCFEEKEIVETLSFPKLPIVVDLTDKKQAATEYEMSFDVSQFKESDQLIVKVKKRNNDGTYTNVNNIGGEGVNELKFNLDSSSKVQRVTAKIQNLEPSTSYQVELTSNDVGRRVIKLTDNSEAKYQILTLTATGITSFTARYNALSYNNKYLSIDLNVVEFPSIKFDKVLFSVVDKDGQVVFKHNQKVEINQEHIHVDLPVFDKAKNEGLLYDQDYKVLAQIYNSDDHLVKTQPTNLKITSSDILIQPRLRQAYDVDRKVHIIHTDRIPVKDDMKMIYKDGLYLQIFDEQGKLIADDYYIDPVHNKTTVSNNGFNTSSTDINVELKPSTRYLIKYTVIYDKNNNGKQPGTNEKLPTIEEYIAHKDNYHNKHEYVKEFTQQITTLSQATHNFGQINYSVNQNKIYIKFIDTNNVYQKLSKIEYRVAYLRDDVPTSASGVISMTKDGISIPDPDKYLTIEGYSNNTFDILLEGFLIPDINLEYDVSMTMYYIGEDTATEIKMKVIAAEAVKK